MSAQDQLDTLLQNHQSNLEFIQLHFPSILELVTLPIIGQYVVYLENDYIEILEHPNNRYSTLLTMEHPTGSELETLAVASSLVFNISTYELITIVNDYLVNDPYTLPHNKLKWLAIKELLERELAGALHAI